MSNNHITWHTATKNISTCKIQCPFLKIFNKKWKIKFMNKVTKYEVFIFIDEIILGYYWLKSSCKIFVNGMTYFPSWSPKKKQFIHTKLSRKVQSKSHFHMTMSDLINATLDSCRLDFYPISWLTFFITKGLMALCLLHFFPKYFYPFKHPIFTADYLCNWCIYTLLYRLHGNE